MADSWVRHIGTVVDAFGLRVHVGVEYGLAAITMPSGHVRLTAAQREQFAQLWVRASHEAAADYAALLALDNVTEVPLAQ